MADPGTPTYDQLRLFLTVVETGSFAGAGRKLNRAVSVISYGIANLEAQLGLQLFVREGTRRPRLTEAGQAILSEAMTISQGMDGLRAKAKGLLDGLEAEVSLAVDVMWPTEALGVALREFREVFPTVALRLHIEALGAVAALVLDARAGMGLSGPVATGFDELERVAAGSAALIPVAAPDHPLARIAEPRSRAAADHIQLVLTDRSPLTAGHDFAVRSPRTWRLADLGAKHALLRQGIGWGNMPLHMVEDDLVTGALVRLQLPDDPGGAYRFHAIHRRAAPPGPAASWLRDRLIEESPGAADPELPDV